MVSLGLIMQDPAIVPEEKNFLDIKNVSLEGKGELSIDAVIPVTDENWIGKYLR